MKAEKLNQVGNDAIKVVSEPATPGVIGDLQIGDWLHVEVMNHCGKTGVSRYWSRLAGVVIEFDVMPNGTIERRGVCKL